MAKLIVRPVQSGDIAHVAANLCAGERMTFADLHGVLTPAQVEGRVADSVLRSQVAHAFALENGPALALFGVVPISIMEGTGALWFLATDAAFEHQSALVRLGRRYVRDRLKDYARLGGRIDARHEWTRRWVRLLGFTVYEPVECDGAQFCYYDTGAR